MDAIYSALEYLSQKVATYGGHASPSMRGNNDANSLGLADTVITSLALIIIILPTLLHELFEIRGKSG